MHRRMYTSTKKYYRKDGTVTLTPEREWKWIKTNCHQKKIRPKGQAKTIWSKRFGYLNLYTKKEKQNLRCPSGYVLEQAMCGLYKLWAKYKRHKARADIEKMEETARQIQRAQEDMGLKTTSFPHLGIYGDTLIFYDHKSMTRDIKTEIDHSHLKEKQKMEEAKERLDEAIARIESDMGIEIDIEKGEEIVTLTDEVPQPEPEIKHRCGICNKKIKEGREHICEGEQEHSSTTITFADDLPFM